MAIFHLSVRMVSRGKGQSAVHKAAYNARTQLEDARQGVKTRDYSDEGALLFSGIFAPAGAPAWAQDREQLWNRAEAAEKRKDAQVAREIEIALPHELTAPQREWLVKDFVREQFVRRGMVADVAIHAPDGDARNHHAHILLTVRALDGDRFAAKKDLEWNSKATLQTWREHWAHLANRHLERHGHDARIDHRTLEAQGIDREPGKHLGPHVMEMEKRGRATERGEQARAIEARNRAHVTLQAELRGVETALQGLEVAQEQERRAGLSEREQRRLALEDIRQRHGIRNPESDRARRVAEALGRGADDSGSRLGQALAATAGQPLMVASTLAGKAADRLVDAVGGFLEFFVGTPAPQKTSSAEFLRDPAARREYYAQQTAERQAKRQRDAALDRLGQDIRAGRTLRPSDVQALPYDELVSIRDKGDDALRALVRQRDRDRERDSGRSRERER